MTRTVPGHGGPSGWTGRGLRLGEHLNLTPPPGQGAGGTSPDLGLPQIASKYSYPEGLRVNSHVVH